MKRIQNLKNKGKLTLSKQFNYYKICLVKFIFMKQKFVILD